MEVFAYRKNQEKNIQTVENDEMNKERKHK